MSTVRCELASDRVAVLTLSRPETRNAIDSAMVHDLLTTIGELGERGDVGAIVITGAGRAFCAGGDLEALSRAGREELLEIYESFLVVARSPLVTVAAVNGPAVGAGLNLALACDVVIAAPEARFAPRFLDLAIHPGGGSTWLLQRAVGSQRARAMLFCGVEPDGEEAVRFGLAARCVPSDVLLDEACGLARRAASTPPEVVRRLKRTLETMAGVGSQAGAVALELEAQVWSTEQPEFRERIEAALAR